MQKIIGRESRDCIS